MSSPVLDRLRGVEGLEVAPGDERLAVHGVVPAVVAAPATAEAAAEAMRLASAEGWIVEACGAGGGLAYAGRAPERLDLLLTTADLAALDAYEPADLTASVGAGMPLGALAKRLAETRQWLPLDPPGAARATLGAVVACAEAGPLRRGYGTPRDHVLGLQLVTGDGRVLDLGGRVVKNVAGYDLVKLVTGSRGTLGFITRVNVRLRPLPEADETLALAVPGPEPAAAAALALRAARIEPSALELLSPAVAARVTGAAEWQLLLRLQGAGAAVAELRGHAESLAAGAGLRAAAATGEAWSALSEAEGGALLELRLAASPAALADTLALALDAARAADDTGLEAGVAAHAGDGIVRVLGWGGSAGADSDWAPLAAAVSRARGVLAERRGSVLVARGPAALMEAVDPYGPVTAEALMRGIKATFDPAGVLAPGRFAV